MALYSHQISLSGFSQCQIDSFMTLFGATLSTIETPEPLPAPDTSDQQQQAVTVPQLIQPAKKEQEHKPLQQATTENTAEKHTEKASNSKTTTANTILRQATKQICRDVTIVTNIWCV